MSKTKSKYPFLYFGHGSAYSNKALGVYILFKEIPAFKNKTKILKDIPAALKVTSYWHRNILVLTSSEVYEGEVKRFIEKVNGSNDSYWTQFENILEESFLNINKLTPILAVYKPSSNKYSFKFSSWHKWSVAGYDKILFPNIYEVYKKSPAEIAIKRALLIILNGYFHERIAVKPGLSKTVISRHIEIINDYFSEFSNDHHYNNSDSIYFINSINCLLSQINENEHGTYVEKLSKNSQLLLYKQYPEKLYSSSITIDIQKLKKISSESTGLYDNLLSDLFGGVLVESNKLNKSNKSELLVFLSEYITYHKLTDILAVNLLYECIIAKGKDKVIAGKIFSGIVNAAVKDKKLLNSKYIKTNISLYYSENKDSIEISQGLKKLQKENII